MQAWQLDSIQAKKPQFPLFTINSGRIKRNHVSPSRLLSMIMPNPTKLYGCSPFRAVMQQCGLSFFLIKSHLNLNPLTYLISFLVLSSCIFSEKSFLVKFILVKVGIIFVKSSQFHFKKYQNFH